MQGFLWTSPVDMECNRQIPSTKFEQVPLIKKLVDQFCQLIIRTFETSPVELKDIFTKIKSLAAK